MSIFKLDTIRLIKKTSNRFLSLVLIVLIGSGFMMGLMSCTTIMKRSVDYYNDEYNLQDVQIYSSYGFCDEDIEAIRNTEGVKGVFASKFVDAYIKDETTEKEYVARIEELNRDVNKFELVSGRLPNTQNECVILITSTNADLSTTYSIGDKLLVSREDEDIKDYLRHDEYTIVGFVKSPAYTSKLLGTSTYNNLDLNAAVYIYNSNFVADYYTTVYLTLDGAIDKMSYTNAYQNLIDEQISNVEDTAFSQQNYYRDIILKDAQEELDENKLKFEEEKANGEKKLADAKKQLDDAHIQIVTYETEVNTITTAMSSLEKEIKSYQSLIDSKRDELGYSDEDIESAKNEITNSDLFKFLLANSDSFNNLIDEINNSSELAALESLIDEAKTTLNKYKSQISSLKSQINSGKAQYESGLKEYNEGLITFNEEIEKAEAELIKAQQTIDELPEASWTVLDRSGHYSSYMFDATCKQMSAVGYSFPLLFYLVAALVCMTTMTRLVDEQRGQIGIYRALGFSKRQVVGKYVAYAFLASIIGSLFGIIIGQLIFPIVIYDAWALMYALPDFRLSYPIIYVLICVLAFSILMMGVTYLVVRKSLEEVPSQLMRPKAPKTAKTTFIEKIPFIWDKLSFTSKITARNLIRYKARFLMTVIGVAGCTGLLIVGWGVKDSVSDVVELQYGKIFNYDYQITLENDHNIDSNLEILKKDTNNEIAVPFMTYSSSVTKDDNEGTVIVEVIDTGDALDMLELSYAKSGDTLNIRSNGVIISEKFAKNNNIKEGDIITIESLNGVKAEVKVSAICEWYFQHYIFMSSDYYETIFSETVHNTSIAVKSDNKESLLNDIDKLEDYTSLSDFTSMIDQFETMIKALDFIVAVIILAAGSLALVVLINLTQVNVSERIREIATLKVLGFRVKEVDSYIFKEIFILTIIGGIVGLPLGTLEHHFVMNVINMEMIMFGMNISIFSYAISFMITIIFTIIVLLLTRKSLRQIQMVESLKSVE